MYENVKKEIQYHEIVFILVALNLSFGLLQINVYKLQN